MPVKYTVKDIRQAYKARNSWWGYFILHPIATRMLWLVANFTFIRPEALCISSFAIGLMAAWYFWEGTPLSLMIGGVLAFMSNLFDAMDGKLARLKGMVTSMGAYLDFLVDVLKHILYIMVLALGQFNLTGDKQALYWGMAVLFFFTVTAANENLLGRIRAFLPYQEQPEGTDASGEAVKTLGLWTRIEGFFREHSLLPAPCGVEFVTLMFIVGPLMNQVMPCLIIGGLCFFVYSTAYTLMILKRTRWLTQGLKKDQRV